MYYCKAKAVCWSSRGGMTLPAFKRGFVDSQTLVLTKLTWGIVDTYYVGSMHTASSRDRRSQHELREPLF